MNLPGVTINGYHCFYDWGCVLTEKTIDYPEQQTYTVEIPGRNGILDLSEKVTGHPVYKNRSINITLGYKSGYKEFQSKFDEIASKVHGKTVTLVFDDDPLWYYEGRATISTKKLGRTVAEIGIKVDAYPYKKANSIKYNNTFDLYGSVGSTTGDKRFLFDRLEENSLYEVTISEGNVCEYDYTKNHIGETNQMHIIFRNEAGKKTYEMYVTDDGSVNLVPNTLTTNNTSDPIALHAEDMFEVEFALMVDWGQCLIPSTYEVEAWQGNYSYPKFNLSFTEWRL